MKHKILSLLKKHWIYIILIYIIILPYIINSGNYLAGNDYGYLEFSSDNYLQRKLYYPKDLNGLGGFTFSNSGNVIFLYITSLLSKIFSPVFIQIITKVFFYSLGYFGIYYLVKEFSKKFKFKFIPLAGALLGFFYCTNLLGFDLIRTWLYYYYIFYLSTPFLIYFSVKFIKSGDKKWLFWFVTMCIINLPSFTNISYSSIQYLSLIIFYIIFKQKNLKRLALILIILTLLNITSFFEYWLTIINSKDEFLNTPAQEKLIKSAPIAQQRFYPLLQLLKFTGGRVTEGTWWSVNGYVDNFAQYKNLYLSPIIQTILFIPAWLIIKGVNLYKNKPFKDNILLLLFLTSLFLVSMFGFPLASKLLEWLYQKIPQLWVYRNSLKFIIILIPIAILLIYKTIIVNKFYIKLFAFYLVILNIYSLTGGFADKYSFTSLPDNYKNLEKNLATLEKSDADKIISYPPIDRSWIVMENGYRGLKPLVVLQNKIPYFVNSSDISNSYNNIIYNKLSDIDNPELKNPKIWQKYSVKYIFLQHDISYKAYKLDKEIYPKSKVFLDNNFEKVLENKNYSVYQTYKENNSLINIGNIKTIIDYKKINPAEYKIEINNLQETTTLNFDYGFSKNWQLKIVNKNGESKLFEADHQICEEYKNCWTLNPNKILNNFAEEYYSKNTDGSINIKLIIYFKPQNLYKIGTIISALSLVAVLSYIVISKKFTTRK